MSLRNQCAHWRGGYSTDPGTPALSLRSQCVHWLWQSVTPVPKAPLPKGGWHGAAVTGGFRSPLRTPCNAPVGATLAVARPLHLLLRFRRGGVSSPRRPITTAFPVMCHCETSDRCHWLWQSASPVPKAPLPKGGWHGEAVTGGFRSPLRTPCNAFVGATLAVARGRGRAPPLRTIKNPLHRADRVVRPYKEFRRGRCLHRPALPHPCKTPCHCEASAHTGCGNPYPRPQGPLPKGRQFSSAPSFRQKSHPPHGQVRFLFYPDPLTGRSVPRCRQRAFAPSASGPVSCGPCTAVPAPPPGLSHRP